MKPFDLNNILQSTPQEKLAGSRQGAFWSAEVVVLGATPGVTDHSDGEPQL